MNEYIEALKFYVSQNPPAYTRDANSILELHYYYRERKAEDQLSVSGGGVDGLFFKINADAQFLQLPYRFQKGHGIPGKAGYGLGDDVIHLNVVFDTK